MQARRWMSVFVVAALVLTSGVAVAKAVKVHLMPYDNPVIGIAEPDASARIVLNYAKGADKTEAQLNAWGLMPDSDYTLYLKAAVWHVAGTFTTDSNGDGAVHVSLPGDHSGHLPAAINNADGYTVLMSN